MNTKLVESLLQAILSLYNEERSLLEEKIFFDSLEPSNCDLMQLAKTGEAVICILFDSAVDDSRIIPNQF
ncbi:MAG: hypothetical protein V7K38_26100 [Nostoc sp.]|uniref:hypothetical protein n=1 Tax=Nostoc sp. TaxID=1180 RepID=UPI002FF8C4B1